MVRLVRRKRLRSRRKPRHLRRGEKSAPECVFFGVDESYQEHHKHHFQICNQHRPWHTMTNIFENHKITSTAQVTVSYSWAQALDSYRMWPGTGPEILVVGGWKSPFLPRSSSTRTNPCGCDQQRVWHMRSMPSCTNFCLQIGRTVLCAATMSEQFWNVPTLSSSCFSLASEIGWFDSNVQSLHLLHIYFTFEQPGLAA